MSDTWKLTTVTAAIAAQSITVTKPDTTSGTLLIQDIVNSGATKLTDGITQAMCPVLQPAYDNFITPSKGFFRDTFGADAGLKTINYTLRYKFFFAPVMQGTTILSMFGAEVAALVAVGLYFMTHTAVSGSTEFLPKIENFSPQTDLAGTKFHGGQISFDVTQYLEA